MGIKVVRWKSKRTGKEGVSKYDDYMQSQKLGFTGFSVISIDEVDSIEEITSIPKPKQKANESTEKSIDDMTGGELAKYANENNLDVNTSQSKSKLLAEIKEVLSKSNTQNQAPAEEPVS